MDWFKELKVSNKLYLLVGIALFFILLTSIVSFVCNRSTMTDLEKMYKENLIAVKDLALIRGNFHSLRSDVLHLFQPTTHEETQELLAHMAAIKEDNVKVMSEFDGTNPSDEIKKEFENYKIVRAEYFNKLNNALNLAKSGKKAEAYAVYRSGKRYEADYTTSIDKLIKMQTEESNQIYLDAEHSAQFANTLLVILGILASILMILTGNVIGQAITRPIQHAIDELTTGSSEVSAAAAQVEAASQSLAEGTTEQAASIQETSSTLEETSSMVQQNNENTKQAATMAKSAKNYAEKSNKEMLTMMNSMDNLKQSSNEIAKIIKVIDEIAFQTNLLSLNAAVEAARAGDAGKGFAVVAEEVRNLAQRSAQAAKDTASIIEKNITLSDDSVKVAKNVNEALSQIDTEARKVSELLEEISTATEEQSRGVSEINKAMQQMEQVMQTNAANADESAAASRQLSMQAENVNGIVKTLIKLIQGVKTDDYSKPKTRSPISKINNSGLKTPKFQKPVKTAEYRSKAPTQSPNPENIIPLNDF